MDRHGPSVSPCVTAFENDSALANVHAYGDGTRSGTRPRCPSRYPALSGVTGLYSIRGTAKTQSSSTCAGSGCSQKYTASSCLSERKKVNISRRFRQGHCLIVFTAVMTILLGCSGNNDNQSRAAAKSQADNPWWRDRSAGVAAPTVARLCSTAWKSVSRRS